MARELITSWGDYQEAVDRILGMAATHVCIFDTDLRQLHLDDSCRLNELRRLVHSAAPDSLRIALRDAEPLRRSQAPLMNLLATHGHSFAVQQIPPHLAQLRDCLILIDKRHALIRFDKDQARSKLLIDEPEELRPYCERFEEIWRESGEPVSPTTLGL